MSAGPPPRRFTLANVMVLVAAVTPAFVLMRYARDAGMFDPQSGVPWSRMLMEYLAVSVVPLIFALMLVVVALGLRDRRRGHREAIVGPGFVASTAMIAASAYPLAWFVGRMLRERTYLEPIYNVAVNNAFGQLTHHAAAAIGGAWLTLVLLGRWKLATAWYDRMGVVLAVAWMLIEAYARLYFVVEDLAHAIRG